MCCEVVFVDPVDGSTTALVLAEEGRSDLMKGLRVDDISGREEKL
jgi:hypothetical protein